MGIWTRWFRSARTKKTFAPHQPLRTKKERSLLLEHLEKRELMANDTPRILSTVPTNYQVLSGGPTSIRVRYSERMSNNAAVTSNYLLIDADGQRIAIDSGSLDNSLTEVTLFINGGLPLNSNTYTLYVYGDRVADLDDGRTLTGPGQVVAANGGNVGGGVTNLNNVGVSDISPTGVVGAMSNFRQPNIGTVQASPGDTVLADFTGDGILDMAVANSTSGPGQVNLYVGRNANQGFGFNIDPDFQLDLPASTANSKVTMLTADFNKDQKEDLVVMQAGGANITVFLNSRLIPGTIDFVNPGTTVFLANILPANHPATPADITIVDINNDGNLDIGVMYALQDPQNELNFQALLNNTGTGAFTPSNLVAMGDATIIFTRPPLTPATVAAGGFSGGTGQRDIVVGAGDGIYVYSNATAGNFVQFGNLNPTFGGLGPLPLAPAAATNSLAVGDLNNDGRDDIVAGTTGGIQVFFQDATPLSFTFQQLINPGAPSNNTSGEIKLADINGDGFLDIIQVNRNQADGRVITSLNLAGTGNFTAVPASSQFAVNREPVGLAIGDVNNDGIADAVTANRTSADASVIYGIGDGRFYQSQNLPPAPNPNLNATVRKSVAGDLDGDGIKDLVVINNDPSFSNSFVHLFHGTPGGQYNPTVFKIPTIAVNDLVDVDLADLDRNGKLDIIVTSRTQNSVGVFLNQILAPILPNGNFNANGFSALIITPTGRSPLDTAIADYNGDGLLDIAVAHNDSSDRSILTARGVTVSLGNGLGGFAAGVEIPSMIGSDPTAIATDDLNRDGRADLAVVTNAGGDGAVVYLTGNGNATFVLRSAFANFQRNPNDIAIGDFNNDGFKDVITTSSDTNAGTSGVSVLLNQFGTGFAAALQQDVVVGVGLQAVAAIDLNRDGFLDVVVSSTASGLLANSTPGNPDNVFALYGIGDGTFLRPVPYLVGGDSQSANSPTDVTITDNPVVTVVTFTVGGTTTRANLIRNGSFEQRDLTGENGNLSGWTLVDQEGSPGSRGRWLGQTRTQSPLSSTALPAPSVGQFRATLDQLEVIPNFRRNFLNPTQIVGLTNRTPAQFMPEFSGSHLLYQDVFVPVGTSRLELGMDLYIDNLLYQFNLQFPQNFSNPAVTSSLDFRRPEDNQQVRVDIMDLSVPGFNEFGVTAATGLLQNLFITQPTDPRTRTVPIVHTFTEAELQRLRGKNIRLRVATVNNRGPLLVGVDGVRLSATFDDTVAPTISDVRLRNPGFVSNGVNFTTDTTVVGKINDNGGLNNISFVEVDVDRKGFDGEGDFKIGTFDPDGNFSFNINNLSFGQHTLPLRVVDKIGNQSFTSITFNYQGPNVSQWQAHGAQATSVVPLGLGYRNVAGRINAIAQDPRDTSGNTYYIGAPNGGIWKTVNGGESWTPLTDYLVDPTGNRIPAPIASIAVSRSNPDVIYALTGNGEPGGLGTQQSLGVLKSTDAGKTWTLIGNSNAVFGGAYVSRLVVDANTPNIAYAAVIGNPSNPANGPGVYKTADGGLTWTSVLRTDNMYLQLGAGAPPTTVATGMPAGTTIASVTDLQIDPFNSNRLLVGLGNIGLATASITAGVWRSANNGGTWDQILGGDAGIANSTLPSGINVGRVAIAMGSGRVGDERNVFVTITTRPTPNQNAPTFDYGNFGDPNPLGTLVQTGIAGLYKSKNNLLNFTKVMLRQHTGSPVHNDFHDIDLFNNEGSITTSLAVDPSNPAVVYVGGAERYVSGALRHALIRVDTSNMADHDWRDPAVAVINNGDDRRKAFFAARAPLANRYPDNTAYIGEGVYWYDIIENTTTSSGTTRLPPGINEMYFDAQGRLLVGTDTGIYRAIDQGFSYDFSSGGASILVRYGQITTVFNTNQMRITPLNGNLQISDVTAVAIDPTDPNLFFTSNLYVGTNSSNALLRWTSQGLYGPDLGANFSVTDPGTPHAGIIRTGPATPGALPGTPTTVYRLWQNTNANLLNLRPQYASDGGTNFTFIDNTGIPVTGNQARYFAPLAVNPKKIFESGIYQDEIIVGTNKIYLTRTNTHALDPISPVLSTTGGLFTALAFAPSQVGGIYAGNDQGEIFYTANYGADFWANRTPNLGGAVNTRKINAIFADPTNANIAFAVLDGRIQGNRVLRTTDAGQTWTDVTSNLELNVARSLYIDRTPALGAPNGKVYVGTDTGVYVSLNDGGTWTRIGTSMPNAPVVDIQANVDAQVLAAGVQGRGLFTIDTKPIVPIADQTMDEDTVLGPVPFYINAVGVTATITITATSSNKALVPDANIVLTGSGSDRFFTITPAKDAFGETTVTITVSDGTRTFTDSFIVRVSPVNDAPTISPIVDQTVFKNGKLGPVSFTVNDVDNLAQQLNVSATTSDGTALAASRIQFSGTGSTRTFTITPLANKVDTVNITLRVTDPLGLTGTTTFSLQIADYPAVPFSTTFNHDDNGWVGPHWDEVVGDMDNVNSRAAAITNGAITVLKGAVVAGVTRGFLQQNAFAEALVRVGFQNQAGIVTRYVGSAGGKGDANYYYGAIVNVGGSFYGRIYKNVNGVLTQIATSAKLSTGTAKVRFESNGNSHKLFWDADLLDNTDKFTLIAFAQDSSLTARGRVGIKGSTGQTFDNFEAERINALVPALPFKDSFNILPADVNNGRQLDRNWQDRVGNYTKTNNQARGDSPLNLATLNGISVDTAQVQTFVSLPATGTAQAGVVARYKGVGDKNYYTAMLRADGTGKYYAEIWKNVNGTMTRLASRRIFVRSGLVRLDLRGSSLRMSLNGSAIASAVDTSLIGFGGVGIRSTQFLLVDNFQVVAIQPIGATLPYTTPFTGTNGSALPATFTSQAGSFETRGNAARGGAVGPNLATLNLLNNSVTQNQAANVAVQANVNVPGSGKHDAGVVARYKGTADKNMYYGAIYGTNGKFTAEIWRNVAGTWTRLSQRTVATGVGLLRFEVLENSLKLFFNNTLVAYAQDSLLTGVGTVGIRASLSGVVDNFSASKIVQTVPNLPYTDVFGNSAGDTTTDSTNLGSKWVDRAGAHTIRDGKATGSGLSNVSTLAYTKLADVVLTADVSLPTSGNRFAGLVARYKGFDEKNMYFGGIFKNGSVYSAEIWKNVNGTWTRLSRSTVATGTGSLKFEVVANRLRLTFRGALVGSVIDFNPITGTGGVGIRTSLGGTADNFSATKV